MYKINKIVSGGQTGADRAGLDAAKAFGIKTGGYCQKGFKTENGFDKSLKSYGLKQTSSSNPSYRTRLNAIHSDGTVIFCNTDSNKAITGDGTKFTIKVLDGSGKPYILNPDKYELAEWIVINKIKNLNVAGNRESVFPGVYKGSLKVLKDVFKILTSDNPDISYEYLLLKKRIKEICNDNSSGSLTVLNNLIYSITEYLKKTDFEADIIKKHLNSVTKCLKTGKNKDMQSLQSFLSSFFGYCNKIRHDKTEIPIYLKEYKRIWKSHNKNTIKKFISSVNLQNKTILLHSNSTMIEILFNEIQRMNIKVKVLQCISSPENEGILQYNRIKSMGFKCLLIDDDKINKYVGKVDFAILGCDAYSSDFFSNKRGSYYISGVFKKAGKPVYVLTDRRKYIQKFNQGT